MAPSLNTILPADIGNGTVPAYNIAALVAGAGAVSHTQLTIIYSLGIRILWLTTMFNSSFLSSGALPSSSTA